MLLRRVGGGSGVRAAVDADAGEDAGYAGVLVAGGGGDALRVEGGGGGGGVELDGEAGEGLAAYGYVEEDAGGC